MTIIGPFIFLLFMVGTAGAAFALMYKNISDISKSRWSADFDPRKGRNQIKLAHPELADVEHGDELLVVKFKPELDAEGTVDLKFTPDKEFEDVFLSKSLAKRMEELDDDEDDDDDGDIIVRV